MILFILSLDRSRINNGGLSAVMIDVYMSYQFTITPAIVQYLQTIERAHETLRLTILPAMIAEQLRWDDPDAYKGSEIAPSPAQVTLTPRI
jgi:hypothetical protein